MAVNYAVDKLGHINDTAATVATYSKIAYDFGKGIIAADPSAVVSGLIGVLNAVGLFEGGEDPNNPSNKTLDDKIDDITVLLNAMDKKLDTVVKNQYKSMTQGYENALDALKTDSMRAEAILREANKLYTAGGGKVPDKNATEQELKDYNAALIKIIIDEEKKNTTGFRGYTAMINRIESNYILVTTETAKEWDKNPIFYNDKCWSEYFNYETEGYFLRKSYRTNAEYQISRAYNVLSFYYEIPSKPDVYKDLTQRMTKALDTIKAHPADPAPSTERKILATDTGYNSYQIPHVYSSTINKTITGWYSPANGVCRQNITTTRWTGKVEQDTSGYSAVGNREMYAQYVKKLHGKTVKEDLKLAFPYLATDEKGDNFGDGIGFGGSFSKSKFRVEAKGYFNAHDWLWYENMILWDGKYQSCNTYDTGGSGNHTKKRFLRFWFM